MYKTENFIGAQYSIEMALGKCRLSHVFVHKLVQVSQIYTEMIVLLPLVL